MASLIDAADPMRAGVRVQWGTKILLRDGVHLNATLYLPRNHSTATPCVLTVTPYVGQLWHHSALYFAAQGYPFLAVDCRGRGNSEGEFRPFLQEAQDGYDIVEWLAQQPYCNGRVAMWGGSYGGYGQWATASQHPPHLATIVPAAAVHPGLDFPIRNNVAMPYMMKWLTYVAGRTSQEKVFFDSQAFWSSRFQAWFESGTPLSSLDTALGHPSSIFQEWISHPHQGRYWDNHNPTREQYSKLSIPILTITGAYDADQPGALAYYRQHLEHSSKEGASRHYLIIGPWDHAGTRLPKTEFGGLKVGRASAIDLQELHVQWYAWTMQRAPRPPFLQKSVAYYVMVADEWHYAETLDSITVCFKPFYLQSSGNPIDVFRSGSLVGESPLESEPDQYVYEPRDRHHAALESTIDPGSLIDQCLIHASHAQLIYHSTPFNEDVEIGGFFRLTAWLAIDQPDTDFRARVYEIGLDGSSLLLSADWIRARHRQSLREERLVQTKEPLRYEFDRFTFVARRIKRGHRLRLVIGPIHSIYSQKNYNSGNVVSNESINDARSVTVRLFHDRKYPSALYVPFRKTEA